MRKDFFPLDRGDGGELARIRCKFEIKSRRRRRRSRDRRMILRYN